MNRRDFLKSLVALPGLAFLKPQPQKGEFERLQAELVEIIKDSNLENVMPNPSVLDDFRMMEALVTGFNAPTKLVRWNGAGDSWESLDGGKTWEPLGES